MATAALSLPDVVAMWAALRRRVGLLEIEAETDPALAPVLAAATVEMDRARREIELRKLGKLVRS